MLDTIRSLVRPAPPVVVSGLPRSGTSLMMRMLEAGGITPVTDDLRTADVDNPGGYYELERVKGADRGDLGWLDEAPGKAVKVISALLPHLPEHQRFTVIFMHRRLPEVLASQKTMLVHRGEDEASDDGSLREFYVRHLAEISALLDGRKDIRALHVSYNGLVADPAHWAERLARHLPNRFDARAAASVVDPSLYRNREPVRATG